MADIMTKDLMDAIAAFGGKKSMSKAKLLALINVLAEDEGAISAAPEAEPAESADLSKSKTTVIALNAPVVTEPVIEVAPVEVAPVAAPAVALSEELPTEAPPPSAIDALASAAGLDLAALDAAILANLDAIVNLLSGAVDASVAALTESTLKEQVVALSAEVGKYRKSDEQSALDEVAAACADGRLLPAQRASWVTLAKATPAATRTALGGLTKNPLLKPHATALTAPTPNTERLADTVVVETDPVRIELSKYLTAGGHKPGSPVYVRAMGAAPV